MNPTTVEFQWLASESAAPDVVSALTEAGAEPGSASSGPVPPHLLPDTDDAQFEPLLLIAGAVAIAHLARAISRIVRDHREGGVVLDVRHNGLLIRERVRGIDAGTVLLIKDDGTERLVAPEEKALLQTLGA
jgi:hypothetical protein